MAKFDQKTGGEEGILLFFNFCCGLKKYRSIFNTICKKNFTNILDRISTDVLDLNYGLNFKLLQQQEVLVTRLRYVYWRQPVLFTNSTRPWEGFNGIRLKSRLQK